MKKQKINNLLVNLKKSTAFRASCLLFLFAASMDKNFIENLKKDIEERNRQK